MRNIDRIPEVVADLESQEVPNVAVTARKHCVAQKTLEDWWKGKTVSLKEAVSTHRQCLTNAQVLGSRLVRSGVIYWSQCVEGLIVMGVVCIGC